LRKAKEQDMYSECTFSPNLSLTQPATKRAKSSEVSSRLYSHALNKLFRVKSIYEERKANDVSFEKEAKECTFAPKTKIL
jgi:hypothetical protein